jgi:hypothetical protein
LDESNCKALGVNFINTCSENQQAELSNEISQDSLPLAECTWYGDILYFLQKLKPPDGMGKRKERNL